MKKLHLEIEDLGVDSFETERVAEVRGTVDAHITQNNETCYHCTRYGCPLTELCL